MFEIENKKLDFKRVKAKDALEIKSLMLALSMNENNFEASKKLDDYAIKHLIIDSNGSIIENITIDLLDTMFENPFVITEISARFMEKIKGFLSALPSFQNLKQKEEEVK